MKVYTKEDLGWNSFLDHQLQNFPDGFLPARVTIENRSNYLLHLPGVGELPAECTGKILFNAMNKADLPKTGDWVLIQYFEDEEKALIVDMLERRNVLSRKAAGTVTEEQVMATHVDKVLIVQGLDDNFNLNRLLRNVVLVKESGITPVIVLNKVDLVDNARAKTDLVQEHLSDVEVLALSALNSTGIDDLKSLIAPGETFVLMGSSGVGKSTLVNRLTGSDEVLTGEVRKSDSKGRHTTTRREMHVLPGGGVLIDTPGTRELQLMSAKESLNEVFDQIAALANRCRYKDCAHVVEAGCAVLAALEEGEISDVAYNNYLKLRTEDAYMEAKTDQKAYLEKKAADKRLHKEIRSIYKKRKFKK